MNARRDVHDDADLLVRKLRVDQRINQASPRARGAHSYTRLEAAEVCDRHALADALSLASPPSVMRIDGSSMIRVWLSVNSARWLLRSGE